MKRNLTYLALILCFVMTVCFKNDVFAQVDYESALAKEGLSTDDMNKFTTYYYRNKQPDKLISILKFMLTQEEMIVDTVHFGSAAHLFATVAHNERVFMNSLIKLKDSYSGMQRNMIEKIIKEAENFISPLPNSPKDLDYLWAEFLATGKAEPIKKIISVLGLSDDNAKNILLIGAAQWSLVSNAKQHSKVYEIIKEEFASAQDKLKEKLETILQRSAIQN
ncbi:MAG: hypothetical protein ABIA97_03730 [Candidatus Omnitrophota bacterium]